MARTKQTARKSTGGCRVFYPHKPRNWNAKVNYDESETSEISDSENEISENSDSEVEIQPSGELPIKSEFGQIIFNKENPLLIECVLAVMMKHFEFDDLKKFRLVHSAWKSVATGMLKWKYFLHFQYRFKSIPNPNPQGHGFYHMENMQIQPLGWEPKLLEFLKNADDFKCDDFRISFQQIPSNLEQSVQNQDEVQFNSLFQKVGSTVKRLEVDACRFKLIPDDPFKRIFYVGGRRSRSYEKNLFLPYLTKNQGLLNTLLSNAFPQLSHLTIRIGFGLPDCYEENQTKVEFGNFSTFPTVQHLEINFIYKSDSYGPFAEKLFKSAPNAQTLVIKSEELYHGCIDHNAQFVNHIYNKLKLLPQLISITIKTNGYPSPQVLGMLPAEAKYLDLLLPPVSSSWEIENLFQKHAPTLEALFLILPEEPDIVQIPQFPKLKKLGVEHLEWTSTPMKLRFINDELFYGGQFPVLEELTLGSKFHFSDDQALKGWNYYMNFLPEDGFPAESIRALNVPYVRIKENAEYSMSAIELMIRVGKMFPSVRRDYFATFEEILEDHLESEREAKRFKPRPKSSRNTKPVNYAK